MLGATAAGSDLSLQLGLLIYPLLLESGIACKGWGPTVSSRTFVLTHGEGVLLLGWHEHRNHISQSPIKGWPEAEIRQTPESRGDS